MENELKNFDSGNKDLDKWLTFFNKPHISNTRFIYLLNKLDKSFLTMDSPFDFDHPLHDYFPDSGLLENDFKNIAYNNNPKDTDAKTRIVLAISHHVDLSKWKEKYNEKFQEVIEKSLVEGDYECYGIEFEKVIVDAINMKLIERNDFMGVSFLRGFILGSRYPDDDTSQMQKALRINKWKVLLGW